MRTGRMAALLATMLVVLVAWTTPAQAADSYLTASDPAPHDELDHAPGWVTLAFRTEADAGLARIVVQDSAGADVTTGPIIVEGTNVTMQLRDGLPQGTYTVIYRTSGSDDQPRGGSFQFAYGKGTWAEVDDTWVGESEQPTALQEPTTTAIAPEPPESQAPTLPPPVTESAEPSQTGTPETPEAELPGEEPGSTAPLWFGIGGILLVAAGATYLVGRRRGGRGDHAA